MTEALHPYVLASVAMSLDGFIDDGGPSRLVLSNEQDFKERDKIRARFDAILVGANTVRRDNPSLLLDSRELQAQRKASGLAPDLVKVTLTHSGNLDPHSKFFKTGSAEKIVYCPPGLQKSLQTKLADSAVVIALPDLNPRSILDDLGKRGIRSLIVEGGEKIHTAFLENNLVNELRVAIAAFFIGEKGAPRFTGIARFPFDKNRHMKLSSVEQLGDVVVLTYTL